VQGDATMDDKLFSLSVNANISACLQSYKSTILICQIHLSKYR